MFCLSYVLVTLLAWFCNLGLEINERPLKRALLDFEKLSIASSSKKGIQ